MTRPLYIFDLDGTLADVAHRRHLLDDKEDSQRWRKFYAACVDDKPNWPVLRTLHNLIRMVDVDVWVWSGRSDEVRVETEAWLTRFGHYPTLVDNLKMRKHNDHRPDDLLKKEWYDAMLPTDRDRLVAIFDDRDKVVAMWRSLGIACFQVAPGDF